jgi:hypothetical protein
MVEFKEKVPSSSHHLFVKEDPARIYRGLKDFLVDEFDIDRIEEGHMEFNMEKPKDRIRLHAFKEKSPYTAIHYDISFKSKSPRSVYTSERPDDILKARIKVDADIITVYPGGNELNWLPKHVSEIPKSQWEFSGLEAEEKTNFQRSKLYKILVGIWYHKFYSKEITRYEEEADETCHRIINQMRQRFGVEKSVRRTDAGQYQPPWQ